MNGSNSESEDPEPPVENFSTSIVERIGVLSMLLVFQVVGLAGNALVLVVFGKRLSHPKMPYAYNYMVFALAACDSGVLLVSATFFQAGQYVFHLGLCRFWQFFNVFFIWAVHLIVAFAIPIERFFAICRPHSRFGKREVLLLLCSMLLLSVPMAALFSAHTNVEDEEGHIVGCHYSYTASLGQLAPLIGVVTWALTLTVSLILYGILFARIRKLRRTCAASKRSRSRLTSNTRVAVMLFGVTIVYIAMWLPYYLLAFRVVPYDNRTKSVFFVNSVSNFIVYALLNSKIRQEMAAVIRCRGVEVTNKDYAGSHLQDLSVQESEPIGCMN